MSLRSSRKQKNLSVNSATDDHPAVPSNQLRVQVRLPSTIFPVTINTTKGVSCQDLVHQIIEDYKIQDPSDRTLVVAPTAEDPGRLLKKTDLILGRSEDDILELWKSPQTVKTIFNSQASIMNKKFILDFETNLGNMLFIFHKVFGLSPDEEIVFNLGTTEASEMGGGKYLNPNLSLAEHHFDPKIHEIVLFQVSMFLKSPALFSDIIKDGTLHKQTLSLDTARLLSQTEEQTSETLNVNQHITQFNATTGIPEISPKFFDKFSKKTKRWFVLKDAYLYYFKMSGKELSKSLRNKHAEMGKVIPLDYYQPMLINIKGKPALLLKRVSGVSHLSKKPRHFLIASVDDTDEIKDYYKVIFERYRSSSLGKTKIFAVDLKEVIRRENNRDKIPNIVLDTTDFLLKKGLDTEGIFRISGRKHLVDYFKELYDHGAPVVLNPNTVDSHTIAQLLKLFLRELPDPLVPYETFDKIFPKILEVTDLREQEELIIGTITKELPEENLVTLAYLCCFFYLIAQHTDSNKMTINNLGTCIGMNLLRPREFEPETLLKIQHTINFVAGILIQKRDLLMQDSFSTESLQKFAVFVPHNVLGEVHSAEDVLIPAKKEVELVPTTSLPVTPSKPAAPESTESRNPLRRAASVFPSLPKMKSKQRGKSQEMNSDDLHRQLAAMKIEESSKKPEKSDKTEKTDKTEKPPKEEKESRERVRERFMSVSVHGTPAKEKEKEKKSPNAIPPKRTGTVTSLVQYFSSSPDGKGDSKQPNLQSLEDKIASLEKLLRKERDQRESLELMVELLVKRVENLESSRSKSQ